VVDTVRGLGAGEALAVLKFMPKAAAVPVSKAIRSAIANAEENQGWTRDDLYVSEIKADEGPRRQWRRFGARGRFKPILRRSSHITVVLTERE
jgi:large subunit ribosomal protein L22